jgi:hypothetical protein
LGFHVGQVLLIVDTILFSQQRVLFGVADRRFFAAKEKRPLMAVFSC